MKTQAPHSDFLSLLRSTFSERCRRNPNYSLRAYARSLGIQASPLSAILRGKRPLSDNVRLRLGVSLGLTTQEINLYSKIEKSNLTTRAKKGHLDCENKSQQPKLIADDVFAVLADWYHFAILELFEIQHFQPDPRWIARTLNINLTEVQIALERLEKCGFLKKSSQGYKPVKNEFTTHLEPQKSSLAKRTYQKQLLNLSQQALQNCPLSLRDHTSLVCAINKSDLDKAKQILAQTRRDLANLFHASATRDDVYQLQISFFPLTNLFLNKESSNA